MEATRVRIGSAIEWVLAAAFMAGAVAVGSVVVREMRTVTATTPVIAREAQPGAAVTPAGLPARAVSVPVLLLPGDKAVRVGDTVAAIAARLGREAEVGTQTVEPARFGDRLTRFYEHAGTRFVLVFEAFEEGGEPKVAAIYLQ
jgi:vacuolar-type H+-ATPase catalytic subunit A/Vma1